MLPARTYLMAFFSTVLVTWASIPFIGNALPDPHGSYIPMLVGHDFVRDEFVRRNALTETPTPCVAFFGDSRVAFNVSGEVINRSLPEGCRSQNYGFASLNLPTTKKLISELRSPATVVISVSETMLDAVYQPGLAAALLEARWIRRLYLGHQRFMHLYRTLNRTQPPDNGWRWSSAQGRWQFLILEERQLIATPGYKEEVAALAENYFSLRTPDDGAELISFLGWAAQRSKKLIVVLPPSETRFQQAAQKFGKQQSYWQLIAKAAREAGATLIDCSQSCVDPSGFADPVHLNAQGVVSYSTSLGRRLAEQVYAHQISENPTMQHGAPAAPASLSPPPQ